MLSANKNKNLVLVIHIDNIDEIIFMFIEHGSGERDENCSEHDAMRNIFAEVKQKNRFLKLHKKVSSHASAFITKSSREHIVNYLDVFSTEKKNNSKNISENAT